MLKLLQYVFPAAGIGPVHFMAVTSESRVPAVTLEVCNIRSSEFPASCQLVVLPFHSGDSTARWQHGGRGGGPSVQRESVRTAVPRAEKWFGARCGPTRRACDAGPADRRRARVPGGLDQQRGSAGASGRCGDPDSVLWQAFGADRDCFSGVSADSSDDRDGQWQLWHHRSG
jgi:hypothetical protein